MNEINVHTAGDEPDDGKFLSEDYGVGGPPAAAGDALLQDSGKTPDILAAEIRTIKSQTGRMVLNASIEVGRRLTEAKAKLPHGSWGEYLKNEVDYSPSQAQNLMRVFREYGSDQQSLFGGEAKSQTFGRLTFSQALSLLVIPDEEERERFAIENDVEHMSVRELNEALKAARDEAEEKAAAAEDEARKLRRETERLREEFADQAQVYEAKLTAANVETTQANRKAQEAQDALDKQRDKAQRLQDALSEANTSAQAAEEEHARLTQELEELRNRPAEADTAAVEAARQAAIAEMTEKVDKAKDAKKKAEEKRKAAEESLEAAQKELAELKAKEPEVRELTQEEKNALTASAVEQARAEGAERLRGLEKQLAAADPNVAEFKVRFTSWQEEHQKMMEVLGRIVQVDEERAAKLRQAVKAALEQMAAS